MKKVSTNYFLEKKKITPKEYLELYKRGRQEDDQERVVIEFSQENAERDVNQILREYLKTNFQLGDQETLLLNAAAKLMLGIRLIQGEKICNVSIRDVAKSEETEKIQASIISLERISRELKKNKYSRDVVYNVKDENGQEIITTDKQGIDDFLEKCTDKTSNRIFRDKGRRKSSIEKQHINHQWKICCFSLFIYSSSFISFISIHQHRR